MEIADSQIETKWEELLLKSTTILTLYTEDSTKEKMIKVLEIKRCNT